MFIKLEADMLVTSLHVAYMFYRVVTKFMASFCQINFSHVYGIAQRSNPERVILI